MQNVNQYVDDGIIDNLKTNDHKYYRGGCWGRYLDIVPNLCRYSNDVVLINAVKGAGKTSLIEALIQDMSEDFKIACLKGNIKSTLEEVMKEIANSFSMSWDDSSDNTEANYDKRPWVLFVDDAHEYAKDIIDNLVELSLSDTDDVKLHLVLISTTDLNINEKKLKSNSTSKIHTLTLEPYTLEETEAFLWYQWHLAGNESKMPISGDTLTKLYKASGGIPEQIIILSKKAMAGEDIESVTPLAKKIDKKQVIVGAVLLGLFYYGTGFILDSSNEKRVKNINLLTGPVTNKKANGEDNKISTDAKKETKPKTEPVINTPKAAVEVSKDMPPKAIESKQPEIKKQSINVNNTPEVVEKNISDLVKSKVIANEPVLNEKEKSKLDNLIVESSSNSSDSRLEVEEQLIKPPKLSDNDTIVRDLNPPQSKTVKVEKTVKVQKQIVTDLTKPSLKKTEKSVTPSPRDAKGASIYSALETKLLNISSSRYGWQIVASGNENKINNFIKDHNLNGAMYYASKYNNQPWFVLIYGQYSSKEEALKALDKMPKNIKNMKPWLRGYDSIHTSIKQSKRK